MTDAEEKNKFLVTRQIDVANFFSVATSTVKNWTSAGMPCRKGSYDLSEIVQWLRRDGPWQPHGRGEPTDPLLAGDGGDSPGLERYRAAKAALAELELAERTGALLNREKARGILGRWASAIRRVGERLGRKFGAEATVMLNDGLADCESIINEFGPGKPA